MDKIVRRLTWASLTTHSRSVEAPMASTTSCVSVALTTPNPLTSPWRPTKLSPCLWSQRPLLGPISITHPTKQPPFSSTTTASSAVGDGRQANAGPMSVDNLRSFIQLNLGHWTGSFHHFDIHGNLVHKISTKLSVGSYGEDELLSLIQTLYIKQPPLSTSVAGDDHDDDEEEWFEYKIKETNMFTVDKYQQIGFFPKEKAFALRYQTAGMLETVLRQGVLGEDDTGEESPRNLKLPSRRPALVCDYCLYSLEKDRRVRAFHIMDPQGFLDMLLVFLEERGSRTLDPPSFDYVNGDSDRITPHLGTWKGQSVTKRSGVYGATIAQADTTAVLEMDKDGQLIQDISSTPAGSEVTTNVHWTGTIADNLVTFDGGFQLTLLPGGMYMGCPCDIAKSVQESRAFHLEVCWLESPGKRQRLVRTYDVEGLAVSSTYFFETKL